MCTCLHDYTLIEFAKCITLFCNSSKILMTGYLVLFLTNKLIESDHIWASIWSLFILFNIFSMLERVLNFALCFCSLPARLLVALCGLRDCILNTMLQHAVISFINQKKTFDNVQRLHYSHYFDYSGNSLYFMYNYSIFF